MADGRWSMTEKELNNTATGFRGRDHEKLPNYKKHRKVDNRDGNAPKICAFCGSENLEEGFGGYAPGFQYKGAFCNDCGGSTDVGRILRTFKIKKNVEVTDNGKDNF